MDFPCGSLCQYCVYKCPVLDPRNTPRFSRFRFLTFWVFFYAVVKYVERNDRARNSLRCYNQDGTTFTRNTTKLEMLFERQFPSDNSWNCRLLGSALKHKLCPEQIILVEHYVWDFLRKVPKDHLHQTSYQPG
ncbi:hypothetical protein RRG08_011794 [Elysia crispata]|uniref:Uncharacterized protein n=1 Tax=Elysia crispata TaxID=231223 RepID=A0AAE1ATS7_9GAST|nr:hypothetical protein RRG08_011794 [Elysia crispata]